MTPTGASNPQSHVNAQGHLNQRMADALDTLTEHRSVHSSARSATPAGHDRGGTGAATNAGRGVSESDRGSNEDRGGVGQNGNGGHASLANGEVSPAESARLSLTSGGDDSSGTIGGDDSSRTIGGGKCGCGGRPSADITIVQHLSADGTDAFAEIAGGGVIPPSVLEEYFCNARIKGVVFSHEGLPLWHSHPKRLATKAQVSALRALYGACGGCGADMWVCQAHHIRPVSQGGPTNIDNMMLLCWACHQKVHHHGWRVVPDARGLHTIAPPEWIRYGSAHAPDPAPAHGPPSPRNTARQPGAGSIARAAPDRADPAGSPSAGAQQSEPLFALA